MRVTLHDVKRQELPPLDDAFAREVGDFENLDALRARSGRTWSARRRARPTPQVRQAADRSRSSRPTTSQAPRLAGAPADAQLRRDVQGAAGAARAFEQQFHEIAETPGPARPGARRAGRGPRARGHRGGARRAGQRAGRGAAACPPASSTPRCRRPTGCRELERAITEEKVFDCLLQQSTIEEVKS